MVNKGMTRTVTGSYPYEAILLDLDGTLLEMDEKQFVEEYTKLGAHFFKDIVEQELFLENLVPSIRKVSTNQDRDMTVIDVFLEEFSRRVKCERELLVERFIEFYATEYNKLKPYISPKKGGKELVKVARKLTKKLVLATNPLFSLAGLQKRVEWADLDPGYFNLITCAEVFSFSKPNASYYKQITEIMNVSPKNSIMIGNHFKNDMVASKLGMKTFWVPYVEEDEDKRTGNGTLVDYKITGEGSTHQAIEFLENEKK